jgi:hypothetical protein
LEKRTAGERCFFERGYSLNSRSKSKGVQAKKNLRFAAAKDAAEKQTQGKIIKRRRIA